MKALIARKLGMTSVLNDDGASIAVTILSAEPNTVTQLKNEETDGYKAAQLGFGQSTKSSKPRAGHLNASKSASKVLKEVRVNDFEGLEIGSKLGVESFEIGDEVDVTGVSKGKGFAGTIKRHNFHRGPKTHGGQSYRRPGSIGSMYPQRIFPGKKMAGHMGAEKVTVKRLKVVLVDSEQGILGVTGTVPGPRKGIVMISGMK